MVESLVSGLGTLGRNLFVFLVSLTPFCENKGSIMLGATMNLKWYLSFFTSSAGAILPVPFLLGSGEKIRVWAHSSRFFSGPMRKIDQFLDSHQQFFAKHGWLALLLITSLPFTGIGIWAGCLIANLAGLDRRQSLWALFGGVILSGLFTTLGTYGLLVHIANFFGKLLHPGVL